jgi:2-oxoglutarate ferredoxin oxidoreductase subunit delta
MLEFSMSTGEEKTPEKTPVKKKKFRGEVYIEIERCKGCGFCVEFCPTSALELSEEFNEKGYHPPKVADLKKCTGCGLCGMYCPDFAIFGLRVKIEDAGEHTPPAEVVHKDEE